jgi:hypothetical protein
MHRFRPLQPTARGRPKRGSVEAQDVQVTLAAEDGQKGAYVRSVLGQQVHSLRPVSVVVRDKTDKREGLALTARIVLDRAYSPRKPQVRTG